VQARAGELGDRHLEDRTAALVGGHAAFRRGHAT
jgi:hypothetical protein